MSDVPAIAVARRALRCGLDVIVHRDPSAPQVCVAAWYRVGSSDEQPGRSGLAHLFEHLFKNSAHMPRHHYDVLRRAGASEANASTAADRTAYYEVVPAEQLELALWLEADRMGYFLPGFADDGAERLARQQSVVRAERRKRYEVVPYGPDQFAVAAALYPEGHPHRYLGIGLHEHIQAATLDDVIAFYRTWYVPANAQLVIAGDVELDQAFDLVERYFGSFPGSTRPARQVIAAPPPQPVRLQVEDPFASLRRVHRAWLGPATFTGGEAELDLVVAAWALAGTGPLWRRLVYERQLAQRVAAWTTNTRLGGELHVAVDARPGADLAEIRAILDDECARPPDATGLARAFSRREAGAIWSLVTLARRAAMLQNYALYTGEPDGLAADLARYREVTPESAAAALARWVDPAHGIEIETVPTDRRSAA
ncbi:MAG TPA: pitrilysin family protein [Kofleriaceae bacterium]|nr:pitrilysin family protein [Kofleriaceae bacterium]